MKKSKTMVVVALAIMLTLSIGYALFSQTINITGSATANGEFEITTTCNVGFPNTGDNTKNTALQTAFSNTFSSGSVPQDIPSSVNSSSCNVSGNNITFSADLKYPGASRLFTIKFANTGTIPARIDFNTGVTQLKNELCLDGNLNGTFEDAECNDKINPNPNSTLIVNSGSSSAVIYDLWDFDFEGERMFIAFEKVNGDFLVSDTDPDVFDFVTLDENDDIDGIVLKPGTAMYAVGHIRFSPQLESLFNYFNGGIEYKYSTEYETSYHFEQYNE